MRILTSLFTSIETSALEKLKKGHMPQHVAIIMDGNGRWATARKLPRVLGHRKGAEVLKEILIASRDLGIKYLTAYSFSSENWERPQDEVKELMTLFIEVLKRELDGLIENDVKLNLIGQRDIIPGNILEVFENAEEKTKDNEKIVFNIAFSYGSRQEIIQALKKIINLFEKSKIKPADIDIALLNKNLLTSGMPDPDLLIRTGGEYRLSNFLLWQSAYAELYFSKIYWPDFKRKYFFKAIYDYQKRHRRFGKL